MLDREVLKEMVRQTKDLFEKFKITGTDTETKIQAVDKETVLFVAATLTKPEDDLIGEFGIADIGLLDGLISFPSYINLSAKREVKNGNETVSAFVFKDANGKGAIYKTMSATLVGEQAEIKNIPWQVIIEPTKSKIAEFGQLVRVLANISTFSASTEDGDLIFSLGDETTSSTHCANMVFESGVTGELSGSLSFDTSHFLSLMKIAGPNPMKLNLTNKGVLGVTIDTKYGNYQYYLRGKR